jgi:Ca2+-binding RTX toxin-like protein
MKSLRRVVLVLVMATIPCVVAPAAGAGTATCLGFETTIVGTSRSDVIRGTAGDDVIVGLGGDDVIRGRGGEDTICGSRGRDRLIGGAATDVLSGDRGDDTLLGSRGNDLLLESPGNDATDGGPGGDEASFALAFTGVDANLATGTATGFGNDTLTRVEGLIGTIFDDVLTGNELVNEFIPLGGNDAVGGGGGSDVLSFLLAGNGVTASLEAGGAFGEGTDTFTSIENLIGSDSDDVLIGDGGDNQIFGFFGDDQLDGGEGVDLLDGGDGTDACVNGETDVGCEA